uniref:Ethanolaminephosphotransferase n=2 Tax=Panagrolaimus sp. JU765 TaxID=591449 RepID=A0AC34QT71_9BILA
MGIFDYKYLDAAKLRGFDSYKYCCIDNSPIAVYISHPFWNWFVKFYPEWLAPNVLTLSGAMLVMGCYFFVSLMDPDLKANNFGMPEDMNLPNWVWLVASICTFVAHLLDGTDGKQARRVGASGPTGELFDHGLDSWSTVPFTITIFSIFGRGAYSVDPIHLLGVLITVQLVFIVTHWEKYNTGVLF